MSLRKRRIRRLLLWPILLFLLPSLVLVFILLSKAHLRRANAGSLQKLRDAGQPITLRDFLPVQPKQFPAELDPYRLLAAQIPSSYYDVTDDYPSKHLWETPNDFAAHRFGRWIQLKVDFYNRVHAVSNALTLSVTDDLRADIAVFDRIFEGIAVRATLAAYECDLAGALRDFRLLAHVNHIATSLPLPELLEVRRSAGAVVFRNIAYLLSHAQFAISDLNQFEEIVLSFPSEQDHLAAFAVGRAHALDMVQKGIPDRITGLPVPWTGTWKQERDKRYLLKTFAKFESIHALPLRERNPALARLLLQLEKDNLPFRIPWLTDRGWVKAEERYPISYFLLSHPSTWFGSTSYRVDRQLILAALAIEKDRLKNGRLNLDLGELGRIHRRSYADPFCGALLHVTATRGGYLLSSCGEPVPNDRSAFMFLSERPTLTDEPPFSLHVSISSPP